MPESEPAGCANMPCLGKTRQAMLVSRRAAPVAASGVVIVRSDHPKQRRSSFPPDADSSGSTFPDGARDTFRLRLERLRARCEQANVNRSRTSGFSASAPPRLAAKTFYRSVGTYVDIATAMTSAWTTPLNFAKLSWNIWTSLLAAASYASLSFHVSRGFRIWLSTPLTEAGT